MKAEKSGERDVKFTFDGPGNRELPTIVGEVPVMPKHWWEGTDEQGRKRDISATTLEKPLGSGPYRIKEFVAGRSIVLERVKDYWGANLPVRIGQNNFDEMRFEFFRDNLVALEAFKADQADWIAENSAKQWATAYEFPAVVDKRVIKEEFPINDSGRMTFLPFILSSSVMTLTALDFLGFGLPPGSPSLGELLSQAKSNVQAPWLGFSGFFSVAIMLSLLIFIGEAVRDAFDPRKTFR